MKFNEGLKTQRPNGSFTRFLSAGLLFCALLIVPTIARADSYTAYAADGTFASGGTLSGSFTVDTTTSVITAANLVADGVDFTCPGGSLGTCYLYTTLDGGISAGFVTGNASQSLYLSWSDSADPVAFPFTTQVSGVSIGSYCAGCTSPYSQDFLASGNAIDAPPTTTPEPGTWVLLLAGLAGMGFLGLRRREALDALAS
jgi:hypothetical protein